MRGHDCWKCGKAIHGAADVCWVCGAYRTRSCPQQGKHRKAKGSVRFEASSDGRGGWLGGTRMGADWWDIVEYIREHPRGDRR